LSKYRSGDTLRKIVILGGGTGGLAAAKHLSEALGGDAEITLIDRRDRTDFRPSYLYVMMGYREPNQVSAPLSLVEKRGVRFMTPPRPEGRGFYAGVSGVSPLVGDYCFYLNDHRVGGTLRGLPPRDIGAH
jgi:hypothetical protein